MSSEDAISILCTTWNVGNAEPKEEELQGWLPSEPSFDLVVVGTQENSYHKGKHKSVDEDEEDDDEIFAREVARVKDGSDLRPAPLKSDDVVRDDGGVSKRTLNQWDTMLADRLGEAYSVVELATLRHMRLIVFARTEHTHGNTACIADVQSTASATGIGGIVGNKGGLIVKLTFLGTSLAFVSSHLAAHTQYVQHRNADFREIIHETRKHIGSRELDVMSEFDHVVWMGDLNYRIDLNLGKDPAPYPDNEAHHAEVRAMIERQEWDALLAADQLRDAIAQGQAFCGFEEGDSHFPPSYKVERAAGTTYESKKMRIPSYTDRILWRSMPHVRGNLRQELLVSVPSVSTSDHKPVCSHFRVQPTPKVHQLSDFEAESAPVLQITRLQASGLKTSDTNGKSDPYMEFYMSQPGLLGVHAPKTKVQRKTVSPNWSDREVPLLRPNIHATDLKHVSLVCRLLDHDYLSHDDHIGTATIPLNGNIEGADGKGTFTIEACEPVLRHGVQCGELSISLAVSFGGSIGAGIVNHKQSVAATLKKAPRERGLSLVSNGLPKTLKLLVGSLEKTSAQLLIKYTKKQRQDPSLLEVATSGRRPSQEINEIDLFLDSLSCIVDRIRNRIRAHPNKVSKLSAPSDIHATLVKVVHRLIPSAWLWDEHPAYAARHVDVIDAILFELGVNRWDWEARAKKADYVPILLTALVMRTSGEPTTEPDIAPRLITSLLKAGATSMQYGNLALVARAEQCTWTRVADLLRQLDIEGSELKTTLEYHTSHPAIQTQDTIDENVAESGKEEVELTVHPISNAEISPQRDVENVEVERPLAVPSTSDTLEEAERLAREAAENLAKVRAESEEVERKRLEMLREMTERIEGEDIDAVDSDDDDVLTMDPEELVQRELARLRESLKPQQTNASTDSDEGEDPEEFQEIERNIDEKIDKLKDVLCDFQDSETEEAEIGSNAFFGNSVKALSTRELQHKTNGESLLMTAVKGKKYGAVALLVYSGALSGRIAQEWNGQAEMYLHEIARQEYDEISTPIMISILTSAGLGCDAIDENEKTALEVAAEKDDLRTLQVMEYYEFQ